MTSRLQQLLAAVLVGTLLLGATGAATAAVQTETADLAIDQPDYIGKSVSTTTTNDTTVYVVHAQQVAIQPQNFRTADVVGFGVESSAGTLSYDEPMDVFRFDAGGETGTFEVYWETETERAVTENNSTTTETVRTRYSAVVRVTTAADYTHLQSADLAETRDDAANWSAFEGEITGLYGDSANIEQRTQQAINLLRLQKDPLAALGGGFTSTWLLLLGLGGPGGVLALLSIIIWHLWSRWDDIKYRNRTESANPEAADLGDQLQALEREERQRVLQNKDWQDIVEDDHVARAMRDALGETVYDGIVRMQELLLPETLVRDRLAAMDDAGYVGVVERVATDGGADATTIDRAWLAHEDDLDGDADTVSLDSPSDAFVDTLDWTDPDLRSFDLVGATERSTEVRLDGYDLTTLVEELDSQRREFDDAAVWGEYIMAFVADVRESDYCDEHGHPDEVRHIMNSFLQIAQKSTGKFDFPLLEFLEDAIERAMIQHDPVREASTTVDDVREGRGS